MNVAEWELLLLRFSCAVTAFALNWMLQSTVLIALGLCVGSLFQRMGAAFQSALYRTILAVVLVSPIASLAFSDIGLNKWLVALPAGFGFDEIRIVSKMKPISPQGEGWTPFRMDGSSHESNVTTTKNNGTSGDRRSIDPKGFESHASDLSTGIFGSPDPSEIPFSRPPIAIMTAEEKGNVVIGNVAIYGVGLFSIVVTIAWTMITFTMAVRLVSRVIAMNRLRSDAISASSEAIDACLKIASEMGVKAPQVLLAPFATSPFLYGIRHPAIILPDQAELSLTDVLVHELAHLRRLDCHWLLLRHVATSILFFQPLLWWLARRIDVTSDEVCDDCVVQFGNDRERYANSLVEIATLSVAPVAIAGVGIISLRSQLSRRVTRILDAERPLSTRISNWIRSFLIGSGLIATSIVGGFAGLSMTYASRAFTVYAGEKSNEATSTSNSPTESPNQLSEDTPAPPEKPTTSDISVIRPIIDDSKKSDSEIASEQQPLEKHTINGTVMNPEGKPAEGARVVAVLHYSDSDSDSEFRFPSIAGNTDFKLRQLGETITDETGSFSMSVLKPAIVNSLYPHISVFATKDGLAADEASQWNIAHDGLWNLKLATQNHVIQGKILDSEGRPALGAKVTIVRIEGAAEPIDGWLERSKSNPEKIDIDSTKPIFNESNSTWEARELRPGVAIFPTKNNYITPSILSKTQIVTDGNGEFSIAGIGDDRLVTLRLDGDTIVSTLLQVVTRDIPAVNAPDIVVANRTKKIHGCNFVYASESIQWIEGTIRDRLSRQPINDALVYVMGSDGLGFIQSRSDKEGRYLLKGLPKNPENSRFGSSGLYVGVHPSYETPYFPNASWAQQRQAAQPIRMDIDLHRGIWIEGQVTDSRTHRPVPVVVSYHPDMHNPHFAGLDINLFSRDQQSRITRDKPTADGKFRVRGFPGKGVLRVVSVGNDAYQLFSSPVMQKAIEKFKGIPVTIPHPGHALVELDIPEIEQPFQVLPELVPLETTNLHFVDEEGHEVADCFVEGNLPNRYVQVYTGNPSRALGKTYPKSDVEFYLGEGEERDRYLVVQHAKRNIGAIVAPGELARFASNVSTTIVMRPNATVTGRLVNAKKEGFSGFPQAGFGVIEAESTMYASIQLYGTFLEPVYVPSRFKKHFPNTSPVKLNEDGSFKFSLPAAKGYALDIMTKEIRHTVFLRDRDLAPAELLDLGTIDLTADPKDWPTPRSILNVRHP